jgi:hypothetical protein
MLQTKLYGDNFAVKKAFENQTGCGIDTEIPRRGSTIQISLSIGANRGLSSLRSQTILYWFVINTRTTLIWKASHPLHDELKATGVKSHFRRIYSICGLSDSG